MQEKVQLLSEVPDAIGFYLTDGVVIEPEALEKLRGNPLAPALLGKLVENLSSLPDWSTAKAAIGATAQAEGAKPGQLMFPLRVALSGRTGGPDLDAMLRILGRDESVKRIRQTIDTLAS